MGPLSWQTEHIGELHCLRHDVDRVGAPISHLVERVVLEDVQHLDDMHAA